MTPDEAEAEAARLGLGKLSCEPAAGTFDPMGETWWTLTMAVAWIAWRTPKLVRTWFPAFRNECRDWHRRTWRIGFDGPVYSGHFLEQRYAANLRSLRFMANYHKKQGLLPENSIGARQAMNKLWDALGEGLAEGFGKDIATGRRVAIPAVQWRELQAFDKDEGDVLRPSLHGPAGRIGYDNIGYDNIELRRQAIMVLWPPHRMEEMDRQLPPTVLPEGPGYMPLYCAAHWIATEGGTITFSPRESERWRPAYAKLLAHIASGDIPVVGVRDGVGEKVDPALFASLRVDYPFCHAADDLIFIEELYLESHAYIDEQHWRGGFDDNMRNRRGVKWSRLQISKTDVLKCWPFQLKPSGGDDEPLETGAPGRPSSMHLIEAEHIARWERGEAETNVGAESRALHLWFKKVYSNHPLPTAHTIENRIRGEHRRRTGEARN